MGIQKDKGVDIGGVQTGPSYTAYTHVIVKKIKD